MSRPKGLDPRVDEILKSDSEEWIEDALGFRRKRQADSNRLGYETSEAYKARVDRYGPDIIEWTWLDDNFLVDRESQYTRTEAEKRRGLDLLKARLETISKRLGEI
jgi:hypothetical protein